MKNFLYLLFLLLFAPLEVIAASPNLDPLINSFPGAFFGFLVFVFVVFYLCMRFLFYVEERQNDDR